MLPALDALFHLSAKCKSPLLCSGSSPAHGTASVGKLTVAQRTLLRWSSLCLIADVSRCSAIPTSSTTLLQRCSPRSKASPSLTLRPRLALLAM